MNEDTEEPIYSRIRIPGFHLMYEPEETSIFKAPSGQKYKYVCTLPGHLEIDFANLQATSERIKKLLIFL